MLLLFLSLLISVSLVANDHQAISFKEAEGMPTATLFAPGIFASSKQAEKYFSEIQLPSGVWVASKHGNNLIDGHYCVSVNFAEILVNGSPIPHQENILRRGMGSLMATIIQFVDQRFAPYPLKELKEDPERSYSIMLSKVNIGQERDVSILSTAYDEMIRDSFLPSTMILYGFSRGAAAAFNFIATRYREKADQRIKAIILEACFDTLSYLLPSFQLSILDQLLPSYNPYGIEPGRYDVLIAFVELCNEQEIPVLLISSQSDEVVFYSSTKNLIYKLKNAGLRNLYFLPLRHAKHNGYSFDNAEDRFRLHAGLHRFYQIHNLWHIPDFANKGDAFLHWIPPS